MDALIEQQQIPGFKRTFRRKKLEADFLRFCQLSTEVGANPSLEDVKLVLEEAKAHIPSEEFEDGKAETLILGDDFLSECKPETVSKRAARKVSLPSHLAGLTENSLLTPEQERALFQRMNFLRFRACKILTQKPIEKTTQWDLERARALIHASHWYRDVIVKANVRLVISIVKKFVNHQCGFDDLLSDGIMALIRSVDKFDYQRGFRFSTYATQVVRRNSYRFVMERQEERLKVTNSINEPGLDVEEVSTSTMSELRWNTLQTHLRGMLGELDKREKLIIRARFSLGGHRKVQTLQKLADRLGISKERVRQLEKRAVEKLQQLAMHNPPVIAEVEA